MLWNARSLSGKTASLSTPIVEQRLDIVFLTETWLKCQNDPAISDLLTSVTGFVFHHRPRTQRRSGGVADLIRSNIKVESTKAHSFKSFECLEVVLRSKSELLRTFVIYRPPESSKNKSNKTDFLCEFSSLLEYTFTLPGFLLIIGDFNFDITNLQSHDSVKLIDLLDSRNLKQHVSHPTHDKGHTLDLVISRIQNELISNITTNEELHSDHKFIQFLVNVRRPPNIKNNAHPGPLTL